MLKRLFSIDYCDNLILEMLKANKSGILAANFIAPLLTITILYDYIPHGQLILWFSLHMTLAISRVYIGIRLNNSIKNNAKTVNRYLKQYILITTITAFSFGMISWGSITYNAPDINIFTIGIIIVALTAGSIATLGIVFISFVGFMTFSIIPFIFALLYHGDMIFNIFASILIVYLIIHILSGHRLFLTYQNTIELEEKFKTIFNKSSDGIAIIKNNRIVEYNETVINMFGYDNKMAEFLSINLNKLMPKKQPDGTLSMKSMLLALKNAREKTITFEWLHLKKNGDEFWVEITLSPIRVNQEKVLHGVWRDISDRKKAEEEIKNLNSTLESKVKTEVAKNREKDRQMMQQSRLAQMGEMISMIAHQWRQPLSAISSTSAGINLKAKLNKLDNDQALELSEKISTYAQHLSSTINDFREFFKSNKNRENSTYNEIIESVLNIVENSITNKNIELIQKLNSKDSFNTYSNEIKQVVLNLLKNAEDILLERKIKNPQIIIETYDDILRISDNGGGIPEDIIDKIFDPYFSTKTKKDGTGLGLYMSKTIIQDHCDGKLSATNNKDGALFEIRLKGI